jgi:hypothetical protein
LFASLYDSPLHVPVIPWIVAALALAWALRSRGFLRAFTVLFALEIAADAWLTGAWTPLPADSAAATVAGVVFVVLGDLRYFLLVERARRGALGGAGLGAAVALSLVVPIATQVLRAALPGAFAELRRTFLLYELLFFAFAGALALFRRVPPGRPDGARRLAQRLLAFELLQYALWATADVVLIGSGADAGFLLRMVPNLMYYACFLPFALWAARAAEPAEAP